MDRATPQIVEALVDLFHPKGIVARNDAAVRTQENLPRETRVLHGEIPERDRAPHEWPAVSRRPAARPEDRNLPRSARELRCCRALCPRTRARLLHVERRLRAPHGGALRTRGRSRFERTGARRGARGIRPPTASPTCSFARPTCSICCPGRPPDKRYDTIVLDPPAFAKSRKQLDRALGAYKEINLRALKVLNPGRNSGVLLLLASRERSGVAGRDCAGRPRRPPDAARSWSGAPSRRTIPSC